ncbi:hypothetical protein, partial [Bacillus cereus]|uniref:hypothetical protein n=1 Tax=Bacillus cereus TaxID=1396 RepID=UPI0028527420
MAVKNQPRLLPQPSHHRHGLQEPHGQVRNIHLLQLASLLLFSDLRANLRIRSGQLLLLDYILHAGRDGQELSYVKIVQLLPGQL